MTEQDRVKHLQDTLAEMEHLMNKFFDETDEWLKKEKSKVTNTMEVTENDCLVRLN